MAHANKNFWSVSLTDRPCGILRYPSHIFFSLSLIVKERGHHELSIVLTANFSAATGEHQSSHSVSASHPDDMWCRKMSFADHCALSISIREKNNKSSDKDCMKNVKHSMSNAKDCEQNGTVKKHKQSEKKKVQVTVGTLKDGYIRNVPLPR